MSKIAIIGSSGLFPGSSTPEVFWRNLIAGRDLTSLANEDDFGASPEIFFDSQRGVLDRCYSLRGGYIRDFKFDSSDYQLPASYLAKLDKLYQWSLFVSREALRDSGYLGREDIKHRCGLRLGNLSFPTSSSHRLLSSVYAQTLETALQQLLQDKSFQIKAHKDNQGEPGITQYTPSQLVVDALGLSNNHYSLDAACASSLYAIKLACDELMTGKADLMLAGAVSGSDQLFIHMGFSIFHAYAAPDEKFIPFDSNSAGLVSSEGAGMVVLKRLDDAERDKDNILGVIGGIGLSNDGRGKFLLSPNPKGQKRAFERAYVSGDVSPKNTTYIECHATGTPLGDTTELNSIANFFQQYKTKPVLGSVKSNIGHLLTAAGMGGLSKVLIAMQKGEIPPNINLEKPLISENHWMGSEQIIDKLTPWADKRKQAGINSFGFGGTNAHMVLQRHTEDHQKKNVALTALEPMAIVGMDAHFGGCTNLDDFYNTIYHGEQHFKALPDGRWKGFEESTNLLKRFGFNDGRAPRGAYIDEFEIDLLRYKIQPKEAETLEPQQTLILKVADKAIKDAGLDESQNVAVLIAMESELAIHHYLARWDVTWQLKEALEQSDIVLTPEQEKALEALAKNGIYQQVGEQSPSQHTSFVGNIMASRIAALWDFSGAAFTITCAENSVFKALEIAQNLLSTGEVDAVVVGGVDLSGGLESVLLRNQKNAINQAQAPSLSFNKHDDGWLVGEGAGAVVLKKASKVADEQVYAVIDAIGPMKNLPQGGYLEVAASGIPEQDQAEQEQLAKREATEAVALGSVKANIGHTYAASGIASLIKAALCLRHRFIPMIPNWEAPKNQTLFQGTTYYFPTKSHPWVLPKNQEKRKAAVNGLGDLQIQLSESSQRRDCSPTFIQKSAVKLFPLSGNSISELIQQLESLEDTLSSNLELSTIAFQKYQHVREKQHTFRLILIAENVDSLKKEIGFFKNNIEKSLQTCTPLKTPSGSYFTPNPLGKKGKLAFVYPGSSAAYTGLGQDIFQLFPQLHEHFEEMQLNLSDYVWPDTLYPKQITRSDNVPNIHDNAIEMMSSGVFFSTCFTHILRNTFKVDPHIAFGYSLGECSSMWYALNVWEAGESKEFQQSPIFKNRFTGNLESLANHWNISTEEAKRCWISLILLAPKESVEALLVGQNRVYLSFINSPNEVVISGEKNACHAIADTLSCQFLPVPFQNVIHHDFCQSESIGLLKMHEFSVTQQPGINFYSSIQKTFLEQESHIIAKNSMEVCCQAVNFPDTINEVYKAGANIFIELGAGSSCTQWIGKTLNDKEHLALSIDQKGKSDLHAFFEMFAQLLSHDVPLDLSVIYPPSKKEKKVTQFLKKITLGGERIFDSVLSKEKQKLFSNIKKNECKKINVSNNSKLCSVDLMENVCPTVIHSTKPNSPLLIKKAMTINEISITTKLDENSHYPDQVGENGLRLQDFTSGEQLQGKEIVFSQQDLDNFATGDIESVFGPEYAIIDSYKRRVMLPMHPYLLVSRVTELKAKLGEYKPSTIQTEYDIPYGAWFTTDQQIPWAVSVESGQCDLFLISYLGIDLQNKGDLVYRLLDCTLTFVDDLPFEGQTLRYDISIDHFVRDAENLLFFFSYRCYVQDRLVLKMDGGCAGFFSDKQLEDGKGVVYTEHELKVKSKIKKKLFTPLLKTHKTAFTKEDLHHLITGDIEKCFESEGYYSNGRNPSLRLPPEKILMIDRITSVDLTGGAYGLGLVVAEKDLQPDDWYFPCHFRDDEVLAGSLQAEGGGNLLRFFMLMLGLQRLTKDARYQPVLELPQKVRCRKQVTPSDSKLVYKLEIKEIGLIPNPYVIGDLEIISDGMVTVHFENLGLQLREKSQPKYLEKSLKEKISPRSEDVLLNEEAIATFALGDITQCFGHDFAVFEGRTTSRQPNTDLQLLSRVMKIDGTRGDFQNPSTIYAEYDVPEDAWYYQQNANVSMPYSILMEIALQPCGLLGFYLGSALKFPDKDLYLRNLDGEGELLDLSNGTDFRGKVITNKSTLVSSTFLGDTILQNYIFTLSVDENVFYKGSASFGLFTKEALMPQVGLDRGEETLPWFKTEQLSRKNYMEIKLDSLFGRMKLLTAPLEKPHYRLAEDQLILLDEFTIAKNSGLYGKGYIQATKFIKQYDWFFACHFYQDPVMPGSLGVEAILQAMQIFVIQQDLGKEFKSPKFVQLANHKTVWKYRGQILLSVKEMHVEVHIKNIEMRGQDLILIADANLWNNKIRIYQVSDLALKVEEA